MELPAGSRHGDRVDRPVGLVAVGRGDVIPVGQRLEVVVREVVEAERLGPREGGRVEPVQQVVGKGVGEHLRAVRHGQRLAVAEAVVVGVEPPVPAGEVVGRGRVVAEGAHSLRRERPPDTPKISRCRARARATSAPSANPPSQL
jgi:hypothetical protein